MGKINSYYNKLLKKISYYTSIERKEIRRIKKILRYQTGNTKIFGFDFTFIDSASFIGQYIEIFLKKVYNFNSENKHPYIVDCGANVGVSILFFKKIFPAAEIIAFEADKNIFSVLKKNIQNSTFKEITLINKGVWNKEGKILFNEEGADGGNIKDDNNKEQLNGNYFEIETTSLRPYLNKKVDFLKIDIEGAESTVLEDCNDLLKNVERIFIEYHSEINSEQQLDCILNTLTKNGFRYYIQSETLFNAEPFIKRKNINNYDNLVCIYCYRK
jgi:FkbM family methyltransferase